MYSLFSDGTMLLKIALCALLIVNVSALKTTFNHGLKGTTTTRPLVIAHRGASGVYPENTIEAYQEAIDEGADFIECDVVVTKDLVLICFHDVGLSQVTNVKDVFPGCEETLYIPDWNYNQTDCFAHRFTLAEIKTIGVRQIKDTRDAQYDYQLRIPTLQEHLDLAKNANRVVGVYPELKNPIFVNDLDIWNMTNSNSYEDLFLNTLHTAGFSAADNPCVVQSFDYESLLYMRNKTQLPCVMLRWIEGPPITEEDLDLYKSAGFYGIGPDKLYIVDVHGNVTDLVQLAHARGMRVHPWTFMNDQLDFEYKLDIYNEYARYAELGIDGAFVDFPSTYRRSLELLYPEEGDNGRCANSAFHLNHSLSPYCFFMSTIVFIFIGKKM